MQKNPDYDLFKNWFLQNGGLFNKINFPTHIEPLNYIGVTASEPIKAHQVFMAIPKKLVISVSLAKQSQIGAVVSDYECLSDPDNEQTEFNILTLYLIHEKQQDTSSFFHPYLQSLQSAQTILQWSLPQIQMLQSPTITTQCIHQLQQQFPPIYTQFHQLSLDHPELFPVPISYELFMECYTIVMTRCFGWGLPQTMLVPFADFFNHGTEGVYHYVFNRHLEEQQQTTNQNKAQKYKENHNQHNQHNKQEHIDQDEYVVKRKQLDLSLLGIDNRKQLPISYVKNNRQQFIEQNRHLLPENDKQLSYKADQHLNSRKTRKQLAYIHKILLRQTYNMDLYPSSNSQDNDSQEDEEIDGLNYKQKLFNKEIKRFSREQLETCFQEPKPTINRQFEDNITFNWWHQLPDKDSYFIIAAHTNLEAGKEIFNSYGRRSNLFLLVWYGFTYRQNKYDSVGFRLWDQRVFNRTGKLVFVKNLTQQSYKQQAPNTQQASNLLITDEYRLKHASLNYQLLSYIRLRIGRHNPQNKPNSIYKISSIAYQLQCLQYYSLILTHLGKEFKIHLDRKKLTNLCRDYFAKCLWESDTDIIYRHMRGVQFLKELLNRVAKGEELIQVYRGKVGETDAEWKGDSFVDIRKFVMGYIRMLDRFLKSTNRN